MSLDGLLTLVENSYLYNLWKKGWREVGEKYQEIEYGVTLKQRLSNMFWTSFLLMRDKEFQTKGWQTWPPQGLVPDKKIKNVQIKFLIKKHNYSCLRLIGRFPQEIPYYFKLRVFDFDCIVLQWILVWRVLRTVVSFRETHLPIRIVILGVLKGLFLINNDLVGTTKLDQPQKLRIINYINMLKMKTKKKTEKY